MEKVSVMQSRPTQIFLFVISFLILLCGLYSLLKDLAFLTTRRTAIAQVEQIELTDAHNPNIITVKYRNDYLDKEMIGTVRVQKHFRLDNRSAIEVSYSRWFQNNLYIREYKEPRFLIVVIDLLLVVLMLVAIAATKKSLTK